VVILEISGDRSELNEFIEVFGIRFLGLIDDQGVYRTYRVPQPQAPYPQDYIIDQDGIVRYWSDEFDPQEMIRIIDRLLDNDVEEHAFTVSPMRPRLEMNIKPNPFVNMVVMTYTVDTELNTKTDGCIKIFDICGRLIKNFEIPPNLSTTLIWYGDDSHGYDVPAGIYFIRLETNTGTLTKSIVLAQ
jgi:hypothetical protein